MQRCGRPGEQPSEARHLRQDQHDSQMLGCPAETLADDPWGEPALLVQLASGGLRARDIRLDLADDRGPASREQRDQVDGPPLGADGIGELDYDPPPVALEALRNGLDDVGMGGVHETIQLGPAPPRLDDDAGIERPEH